MRLIKKSFHVTVLVENTASGRGLLGEHGLSYFIEVDSHRILFDTGQGLTLRHNAKQLGISLLEAYAKRSHLWLELGLESSHDQTLRRINRAHTWADFEDAVRRASGREIAPVRSYHPGITG
jgi:coproporphyrinogen III oxidase-like Fe-S oxidoreductase